MTDETRRWRDEGDLPRGLLEALEAGRQDLPSERELDALEASVLAAIGGGGGGGGRAGGSGGGGAASGATKGAGIGWVGAGAALVVAAGVVAVWSSTRPEREERAVRGRQDAATVAEVATSIVDAAGIDAPLASAIAEPERAEALPEPAPSRRRVPPDPRRGDVLEDATEPTSRPASAVDEMALLAAARRALAADPAEALAITGRMAEVPSPAWAEERERVAIEALHRLGRDAEARARLDRFVATYPRSAYRARLEEILAEP